MTIDLLVCVCVFFFVSHILYISIWFAVHWLKLNEKRKREKHKCMGNGSYWIGKRKKRKNWDWTPIIISCMEILFNRSHSHGKWTKKDLCGGGCCCFFFLLCVHCIVFVRCNIVLKPQNGLFRWNRCNLKMINH